MDRNTIDWCVLGARIAEMRMAKGITQFQLAEKTGLSRVYIGYIEQGKRGASFTTYLDIVTALGYTLNDLIRENLTDPTDNLITELGHTLTSCTEDEKQSIVRIFLELLHMIRMFREG